MNSTYSTNSVNSTTSTTSSTSVKNSDSLKGSVNGAGKRKVGQGSTGRVSDKSSSEAKPGSREGSNDGNSNNDRYVYDRGI